MLIELTWIQIILGKFEVSYTQMTCTILDIRTHVHSLKIHLVLDGHCESKNTGSIVIKKTSFIISMQKSKKKLKSYS